MRSTYRVVLSVLFVVLALVAASCGDDDDDDGAADTAPAGGTTETSVQESVPATEGTEVVDTEPVTTDTTEPAEPELEVGGEATVLVPAEVAGLDPVMATPSASSTGHVNFALYGALAVVDSETLEVQPVLAESFEPDPTSETWTLTLREGLVFSDGSPFTAEAIKVNWERHADPASGSRSAASTETIASMTVVDERTLEIGMARPNALFDYTVAQTGLNFIVSPDAIASGADLTNEAVGAGPFVLEEWVRDSHMTLARNPDWYDAPRPYLDRLTFRVLVDEGSRIDTFVSGDGDAVFTPVPASAEQASERGEYHSVAISGGTGHVFNVTRPPFDDPRMRQVFALGIDREALVDIMDGAGAVWTESFVPTESPFYSEGADLPDYDPEAAQELLDAYVAEHGPVSITLVGGLADRPSTMSQFAQTSLNQLEGIEVEVDLVDQPVLIERAFGQDFDVIGWGYPALFPDPAHYLGFHGGVTSPRPSAYSNPDVDAAFDAARVATDDAERTELYQSIYAQLAEDLPYLPYVHPANGFAVADTLTNVRFHFDGVLRTDLLASNG
jgi:peptide/nickel transport system substrate-binding protein